MDFCINDNCHYHELTCLNMCSKDEPDAFENCQHKTVGETFALHDLSLPRVTDPKKEN